MGKAHIICVLFSFSMINLYLLNCQKSQAQIDLLFAIYTVEFMYFEEFRPLSDS